MCNDRRNPERGKRCVDEQPAGNTCRADDARGAAAHQGRFCNYGKIRAGHQHNENGSRNVKKHVFERHEKITQRAEKGARILVALQTPV